MQGLVMSPQSECHSSTTKDFFFFNLVRKNENRKKVSWKDMEITREPSAHTLADLHRLRLPSVGVRRCLLQRSPKGWVPEESYCLLIRCVFLLVFSKMWTKPSVLSQEDHKFKGSLGIGSVSEQF